MSVTPASGLLAQWERAGQVVVVPMGGVQFVAFQQTPAIGTRDLGSCSVVVIASKYGAILAHIPPLPAQPSADPYAGDNNVRSMMRQVKSLHAHYKSLNYFPDAGTSIICARFRGAVALPDQLQIMQQSLHELGYAPSVRTYDVPGNRTLPGQGTVIVISNASNGNPVIYVEDRAI
jgi:hypothetical protein